METLPEEIQYTIYKYKHQLEYKHIIDELTNLRIKCFLILIIVIITIYL